MSNRQSASSSVAWPTAEQFNAAIQNLSTNINDEELRGGTASVDSMGMPLLYSGGFADVYQVHCPLTNHTWAVKCFTKGISGQCERYRKISKVLDSKSLPFTVDFEYLEKGVLVRGKWFPIVKMKWVKGQTLNEFVGQTLDAPNMLDQLFKLWVKLAARLHREKIAHADLQHGNVILVPKDNRGRLLLKLIDYDGMWVPKLAGNPSGELGHANYQHPHRKQHQIYSQDVDRFSHLVICCALRCISVGGQDLWKPYDNKENLLFVESDFQNAADSRLFKELWTLRDRNAHSLVGHLVLATKANLDEVPHLHELVDDKSHVRELTRDQEDEVESILHDQVQVAMRSKGVPDGFFGMELPEVDNEILEAVEVIDDGIDPLDQGSVVETPERDVTLVSNANEDAVDVPDPDAPTTEDPSGHSRSMVSRLDGRLASWAGGANTFGHNVARMVCFAVPACAVASIAVATSYFASDRESSLAVPAVALSTSTPRDEMETEPVVETETTTDVESQTLTNSIGIQFRLIPAGTSKLPSPHASEQELLEVQIPSDFFISVHEVTQTQYREVTGESPSFFQGDDLPVEQVSALDADEFCSILNAKERLASQLPPGLEYRLPTQAEWAFAAHAGETNDLFLSAEQMDSVAWTSANAGGNTHAVGEQEANPWDLCDMRGNVDEWVLDEPLPDPVAIPNENVEENSLSFAFGGIDRSTESDRGTDVAVDPLSHGYGGSRRLKVGGNWESDPSSITLRGEGSDATDRSNTIGFRVVLAETPTDILAIQLNESLARRERKLATGLMTTIENRRPDDARLPIWRSRLNNLSGDALRPDEMITNSIGMKLLSIPAGDFEMGAEERDSNAMRKHKVRIPEDYFLGMHEVTQAEYESIMAENPSQKRGPQLPVEHVPYEKAIEFCRRLTASERRHGRLPTGRVYRLPTETEWEYAARAGTTTKWFFGDDEALQDIFVWNRNNAIRPRSVGYTVPNQWGMFDVAGNVGEWVSGLGTLVSYSNRDGDVVVDPLAGGSENVVRGGSVADPLDLCSSAARASGVDQDYNGFRVSIAVPIDTRKTDPLIQLALDLEAAINHKNVTAAVGILGKIRASNPSDSRLSAWKERIANLAMPTLARVNLPVKTQTNSIGIQFVPISPGEFEMGSNTGAANERPVHRVEISRKFYLGIHEVTQAQYKAVTGQDPSRFKGADLPVENVSADDADEFCRLLTDLERASNKLSKGLRYRLPTEAQWEFAARAGTTTQWYCGDTDIVLDRFAWYSGNSGERTHPVGQKEPNAWGLYDMSGNVFEWTSDNYLPGVQQRQIRKDATDPASSVSWEKRRTDRGGSWYRSQRYCRSANRNGRYPKLRRSDLGFRVALVDSPDK